MFRLPPSGARQNTVRDMNNYFSHDSNARNSEKLIRLRVKHGAAGYGVYFMLLERLREEPSYVSVRDYNMLAFDLRADTALIKSVVENFGLFSFTEDGECFYSESFCRRMREKDDKAAKARESVKKRWDKRFEYDRNTNVSKEEYDRNTNVEKSDTIKERKEKDILSSSSTSAIAGEQLSMEGFADSLNLKSQKEKSCAKKEKEAEPADTMIPIDRLEEAMRAEAVWIESMCMNLHKSREWIDSMIHEYCVEQQLNGTTVKLLSDAKRHFRNYIRKAEERTTKRRIDERRQTNGPRGAASPSPDELARAVAEGIARANTPQEWDL